MYELQNPPTEATPGQAIHMGKRVHALSRFAGAEAKTAARGLRDGLSMSAWLALSPDDRLASIERHVIAHWRAGRVAAGLADAPIQETAVDPSEALPAPAIVADPTASRWSVACGICGDVRPVRCSPRPVAGQCGPCRDRRQALAEKARRDRAEARA